MFKNTAGQVVGAQMVSASDGSAFTGSVTVAVTVDGGTQATGTVGSGACTHEGGGYHTYAPSQAETNGDLIAYSFSGSGAIPTTVQVFTITGDAFARLGAPAGADIAADIAAVKSDSAAILDDTGTSGVVVSGSSVRTAVGLASANLDTQLDALPTTAEVNAEVDTALLDVGLTATITGRIDAAITTRAAASALATAQADLDTLTGSDGVTLATSQPNYAPATAAALTTVGSNVSSILADTGTDGVIVATNNDKTGYSIGTGGISAASFAAGAIDASSLAADAIDEILDELIGDSTITLRQAMRVMLSALAGKVSGADTTSVTFRNVADDTNRIVATVDANGNRSSVTLTV